MNLYINELKNKEVITSYNFARNSDNVFSEIITKDKFDLLDNKNKLFKIRKPKIRFYISIVNLKLLRMMLFFVILIL